MKKLCFFFIFTYILLNAISCKIYNISSEDNTAPNISILFPIDDSTFFEGQLISIRIDASDKNEISKVDLLINGVLEKTFIDTPYIYNWNSYGKSGSTTIMAKAIDENDNVGTSEIITINVIHNTAPTASFKYNRGSGTTDDIFIFNAAECEDSEQGITELKVRWDWESDDIWDTDYIYNKVIEHKFDTKDVYTVTMEVVDPGDLSHIISKILDIRAIPYEYQTNNVKDNSDYFKFAMNMGSINALSDYDIVFYSVQWQPAPQAPIIIDPRFRVRDGLSVAALNDKALEEIVDIPNDNEFVGNFKSELGEWYQVTDAHVIIPLEKVYVVNTDDGRFPAFKIVSYYDENGNSGVFTINWKYLTD